MNRFVLLGSQTDAAGQEWCYILDTESGVTFKSIVQPFGGAGERTIPTSVTKPVFTATVAVKEPPNTAVKHDPAGEVETKEQRDIRIAGHKVPPAFMGDIRRMNLDPAKSPNGITDVTPMH